MIPIIGPWLRRVEHWVGARPARFLFIALAINAAFIVAYDRLSVLPSTGPDIVDLHASNSVAVFEQIRDAWNTEQRTSAEKLLWLDLLFPFAYSTLLSGLYYLAIRNIAIEPRRLIVAAPFVAGVADWTENAFSLWLLAGHVSKFAVRSMFIASIVKFSLLSITVGFLLAALTRRPAWRVIKTSRYAVLSLLVGTFPLFALGQGRDLLVSLSNYGVRWHAVSFVAWLVVWAFSTWYWTRVLMDAERSVLIWNTAADAEEFQHWAKWLPRWVGALTLIIPGVSILADMGYSQHGTATLVIGMVCVGLGLLFLKFTAVRRDRLGYGAKREAHGFSIADVQRSLWINLIVSAIVSAVMFVLLTFVDQWTGRALGAAAILAIAAANTVFFGSVAAFITRAAGPPIEALLIICALSFSLWNDNHLVQVKRPFTSPPLLKDAFAEWKARTPEGPDGKSIAVVVVAEGGGIRAAYWTASILHLLDAPEQQLHFSDHLFAISSVSGSSLGAALYAGLQKDLPGDPTRRKKAEATLRRRFLAPMVGKLVTGDFAQWFLPLPIERFDRSPALENGFANAYAEIVGEKHHDDRGHAIGAMAVPMGEFRNNSETQVPVLFFNSTSVRTGRRVVTSTARWLPDPADDTDPIGFHEFVHGDVSVARAAHNSARFPVISAAGALRDENGRYVGHLVDGGYFENTGAETAIDVIESLRGNDDVRFVVISIANSPRLDDERSAAWRRAHFLGELLGPFRALVNTRDARGLVATYRLRQLVNRNGQRNYFDFRPCFEGGKAREAPLGWQLSDETVARLEEHLTKACVINEIGALRTVLNPSPAP
jgi:hypothetical protein